MKREEMAKLLYEGNEDVIRRSADAPRVLRSAMELIREVLLREGNVAIDGVGRLWLEVRRAYWHPHPQTGELIKIKPRLRVKFKPFEGSVLMRELKAKRDLSWVPEEGGLDEPCLAPWREDGEHDVYTRRIADRRKAIICRACGATDVRKGGMRR